MSDSVAVTAQSFFVKLQADGSAAAARASHKHELTLNPNPNLLGSKTADRHCAQGPNRGKA